jgi:hypothetical protein
VDVTPNDTDWFWQTMDEKFEPQPFASDEVNLRAALDLVLPLYRDRLLTELADELGPYTGGTYEWDDYAADWLRSKVGGDSG